MEGEGEQPPGEPVEGEGEQGKYPKSRVRFMLSAKTSFCKDLESYICIYFGVLTTSLFHLLSLATNDDFKPFTFYGSFLLYEWNSKILC